MPRVTLNPALRVKTRPALNPELRVSTSPSLLGDLPTALGVTFDKQQRALKPIDPPIKRRPPTTVTTAETASAIARSYKDEGVIEDDGITGLVYQPRAVGHPSDYTKKHPTIAFNFALLGLTDERIATAMGICVKTFYTWCNDHPEFLQAIIDGRENVDGLVINAMFKRATGFKYTSVKILPNKEDPERPIYAPYEEFIPPDVNAGKYWLGIRRGRLRKDGWDALPEGPENSAPPVQININVADPQEAAKQYREMMQLEGVAE